MKTITVVAVFGILAVVLHGTVMPHLAIFGGRFNFLVALVSVVALYYGALAGFMAGLWVGLLADITLGTVIGMAALPLVLIGYTAGYAARYIYSDAFLVPVVVGFIGTASFEVAVLLFSNVAFAVWWRHAFLTVFIPTVLINGALLPWVHLWLVRWLPGRREEVN